MENKKTFLEYLIETDRSDIALQQQHGKMPAPAARRHPPARQTDFQSNMGDRPNRGDIVLVRAARYIVAGGSREGLMVKQIGGGEATTIPHGTNYKKVGVSPKSGKNIFKALLQ